MRFLLLLVMKPAKQGVQHGWVEGNAGASGKKGNTDAVDVRPDAPLVVTTAVPASGSTRRPCGSPRWAVGKQPGVSARPGQWQQMEAVSTQVAPPLREPVWNCQFHTISVSFLEAEDLIPRSPVRRGLWSVLIPYAPSRLQNSAHCA